MSKTNKIRKLKLQNIQLKKDNSRLVYSNERLLSDVLKQTRTYHQPISPPEYLHNNYSIEQKVNQLHEYVYKQMNQFYQEIYDMYPSTTSIKDIEFVLYLSERLYHKLHVCYNDNTWNRVDNNIYFHDQRVILIHSEDYHCNFVRIK
jgi:hypothetical protein